jgi:hypothetical protein
MYSLSSSQYNFNSTLISKQAHKFEKVLLPNINTKNIHKEVESNMAKKGITLLIQLL